jgi:hypothetical protein
VINDQVVLLPPPPPQVLLLNNKTTTAKCCHRGQVSGGIAIIHTKRMRCGAKGLFGPFLASRLRARRSTPSAIREFRGGDAPFPPAPAIDFQLPSETRMGF